jgi:hypothetical protein
MSAKNRWVRLALCLGALTALAPGCKTKRPIPDHVVRAGAEQGPLRAGSDFRLVAVAQRVIEQEDLTGLTYYWTVDGPCQPKLNAKANEVRQSVLHVARTCGPEEIKITLTVERAEEEGQRTFSRSLKVEPIANLFGVVPVRPEPRPSEWKVLDDFKESPRTKRTTVGTKLGVWNFNDARCRYEPGDEGALRFTIGFPMELSSCGLFIPLAEDEKGNPKGGTISARDRLTIIVRSREKEVPFVLEVTEFDKFAAYNQGPTKRSGVLLAAPGDWRRHEIDIGRLATGMDRNSIRQIGIALEKKRMKDKGGVIEIDEIALIKR